MAASPPQANGQAAAVAAGWSLGTSDQWADKYFDPNDLHYLDRRLFGQQPAAVMTAVSTGAGQPPMPSNHADSVGFLGGRSRRKPPAEGEVIGYGERRPLAPALQGQRRRYQLASKPGGQA